MAKLVLNYQERMKNLSQLLILAAEIQTLIEEGNTEISEGSLLESKYVTGRRLIEASFGKNSDEFKSYRGCKAEILPTILRHLASIEKSKASRSASVKVNIHQSQNQSQVQQIHNEIALQILLNIEHSNLIESEKESARHLVEQVTEEVQKPKTNWDKVTQLLRKSFDYGLKIAPEIVNLAASYYQAKGGA